MRKSQKLKVYEAISSTAITRGFINFELETNEGGGYAGTTAD